MMTCQFRLVVLCLVLFSWAGGRNVHAHSEIPSDAFLKGFQHELSNRAFAMRLSERLTKRLEGDEQQAFWQAYLRLEHLNAPRYQAAASAWGLDAGGGWWAEIRAWAISLMPKPLMKPGLKAALSSTVAYVGVLNSLRQIGPAGSQDFLNYMVAQEELQVEMMQLALRAEYAALTQRVDDFIRQHGGTPSPLAQ